ADLVVGNPPYGHVADPAERAFLLRRLPALRGGEIDRYAAFLLRSLELLRPGGTAALLVPDTWMTNARSGPLREAVLDAADVAAAAAPLSALCMVGYGVRTGDNARFVARRPPLPGELGLVGGEDVVPFALRLRPKALRAPTAALHALAGRQLGRPRLCVQR